MENSMFESTNDETCFTHNGPFKVIITGESIEGQVLPDTYELNESFIVGDIRVFGEKWI
ncbi:hypothetical protein RE474_04385 [Methanolobus sediminis]|uniref:Uncharacterized protein n=1 Tax=Methanolobus sediminis TaxID=3072978 RepID=A0AA51YMF5_9EURY|nr:hypothetical protein [Methanolobus sediminis]WMW25964.1 hypothetical protein RE474_04385 [Methanolobus sediminis]